MSVEFLQVVVVLVVMFALTAAWSYVIGRRDEGREFCGDGFPDAGVDMMTSFERGYLLAYRDGLRDGTGIVQVAGNAAKDLVERSGEMGVKMPVEISGGPHDGLRAMMPLGSPGVIVVDEAAGTRAMHSWTARSCAEGKRWVYEFQKFLGSEEVAGIGAINKNKKDDE